MRKNVFIKQKKSLKEDYAPVAQNTKGLKGQILQRALDLSAGLEMDLRNPDKLLDKKGKDLTLYDVMMLDGRIQSTIELKKQMVLSVPNKVIAASDEPKDVEKADFVQQVIDDLKMPVWDDVLDNLLDSIIYGFKIGELIWADQVIGGKWTWAGFRFKHSTLFDFEYDEYGNLKNVLVGYRYGFNTKIDPGVFNQKFIYMPYPYLKDGNYYGDSELKEIYAEWWQKYNITRWRGVYLQNFCMPVPKIIYDKNKTSQTEINELDAMFDNWQEMMRIKIPGVRDSKTGVLIPKFDITFTDPGTKDGANQYNQTIDALDKEISRKLLFPDKIGFTTDAAGSYAQSKEIMDIVKRWVKRTHARLEGVIYPKIQQLIDLNFPMGDEDEYPYLKFDEVDDKIEANLLQILLNAKVIDRREKWMRSYLGLPEITQEEREQIEEAQEEDRKNQRDMFGAHGYERQYPFYKEREKEREEKDEMKRSDNPCNFKKIEKQYETFENDFIRDYNSIMKEQGEYLVKQIESKKIIEDNDLEAMKKLRISKAELKKLLSLYYAKLFITGKVDAIEETEKRLRKSEQFKRGEYVEFQIENIEDEWLDREWIDRYLREYGDLGILTKEDKEYLRQLRQKAFFITGQTEERVLREVYNTITSGLRSGTMMKSIIAQVQTALNDDRERYALTIARTNASDAYNTGRMNFFTSDEVMPYIEAYQFSAVLDENTTEFCRAHDGQIIRKDDPDLAKINPPCHYNCRSLLIPITIADKNEPESYFYDYDKRYKPYGGEPRLPAEGFGG